MFETVSKIIGEDENTSLFLVDIGVMGFQDALKKYAERVMNIGIFEDGMISVASGMALSGFIPIIYGITPFIVERALEQLKLDFAYQKLGGNFITTGAAYDFSTLGYSHYCPEDLGIIQMLPGFEFIAPGTPKQFDKLFKATYDNGKPTYFRLTDYTNKEDVDVKFGKATVIKKGKKATIIAVSTMLDIVMDACWDKDVTILYYTTLLPFDRNTLIKNCPSNRVLLCEPHFYGILTQEVVDALSPNSIRIGCVGLPRDISRIYGTKEEKDKYYKLTSQKIEDELRRLLCSNY